MTDQLHPRSLELTERQRRLLWEVTTMVDVDTLNDNLEQVNVPQVEASDRQELEELATVLDPYGVFQKEWSKGPHAGL